jgi:hypothetical protein
VFVFVFFLKAFTRRYNGKKIFQAHMEKDRHDHNGTIRKSEFLSLKTEAEVLGV